MSYSFSAQGATKAELIAKVAAELDKVVASQPTHTADRKQAQAAVESFLGVLPDPEAGQQYTASVNGSIGWLGTAGEGHVLTSAGIGVSISIIAAEPSKA